MKFVKLTDEERKSFRENGYLVLKNILNKQQTKKFRDICDHVLETNTTGTRFPGLAADKYDGIRDACAHDERLLDLVTVPAVLSRIIQFMGPNICVNTHHIMYNKCSPDAKEDDRETWWHRETLDLVKDCGHQNIPFIGIKVGFYFTDCSTPNSGSTLLCKGTNNLKDRLPVPEGMHDPENVVEPSLEEGDCLFFDNRTFHCSGANLSGRTRKAMMVSYSYRWFTQIDVLRPAGFLDKMDPMKRYLFDIGTSLHSLTGKATLTPTQEWCDANGISYPISTKELQIRTIPKVKSAV